MKKLFTLILLATLFVSCAEDDNSNEPTQEYTSFVFYHSENVTLNNCVAGYYTEDGLCKKLGDLGDLTQNKHSNEIRVDIDTLQYVYLFTDYMSPRKANSVFKLKRNRKNIFELEKGISATPVNKESIYDYPH